MDQSCPDGLTRRVVATDFDRWPEAIKQASCAPVFEHSVSLDVLALFLGGKRPNGASWVPPSEVEMFPKIAVCSWKCFPWLMPPQPGVNLFNFCSMRMRTVLKHWQIAGEEPVLRYFPSIDFSDTDEFRFLSRNGKFSLIRSILRSYDPSANAQRANTFLVDLGFDLDDVLIDVAVGPPSKRPREWIVELNPVLRN